MTVSQGVFSSPSISTPKRSKTSRYEADALDADWTKVKPGNFRAHSKNTLAKAQEVSSEFFQPAKRELAAEKFNNGLAFIHKKAPKIPGTNLLRRGKGTHRDNSHSSEEYP